MSDNGFEALIHAYDGFEFQRFEPQGRFYQWRQFQDDHTDKVQPGTALDPILMGLRVAETILVGLAFAKGLGWEPESSRLGFAFKWKKISGRSLDSWAGRLGFRSQRGMARDDQVTSFVQIPLDVPNSAIAPHVSKAVRPLFVAFEGYEMREDTIEGWVQRLIDRKL